MKNEKGVIMTAILPIIMVLLASMGIYIYNSANMTVNTAVSEMGNITNSTSRSNTNTAVSSYSNARNEVETASAQMAQQEKEIYNAMVKKYIGDSVKGSSVKLMIEDIISQNSQYATENGKFTSIKVDGMSGVDGTALDSACKTATSNNSSSNVSGATTEMSKVKSKLSSAKNYKVTADYTDGVITSVTIQVIN